MFKFNAFLVMNDYQKFRDSGRTVYKAIVDGQQLFELGKPIPAIRVGNGCVGFAKPYEMHISQHSTIVFFTMVNDNAYSNKMLEQCYKLYMLHEGANSGYSGGHRQDSDTARSGMDAATRMMMGVDRSARQIARGDDMDEPDGGRPSITDYMRQSNPGDPFFDDDY